MTWEMPKPGEIVIEERETSFELLPKGKYVFTLLPGSAIDEQRGRLNINTAVADGPSKGRRVFPSLPQPTSASDWPNQVIAKLALVTGTDFLEGEPPQDYLNRVATNGHSRYTANVYHRKFVKKDGSEGTEARIDFNSIAVAA